MARREAFADFPLYPLHKGLLEKAFLKYLRCLVPPYHTSNLNPLPSIYCAGCHTGISVGSRKIPSRQREKQRNEGGLRERGEILFLPLFLTLLSCSSKTNSAALTGCRGSQCAEEGTVFLVWSANPVASMIHNVVRSASYL